jgi:hypothetical protein
MQDGESQESRTPKRNNESGKFTQNHYAEGTSKTIEQVKRTAHHNSNGERR